MAEAKADVNKSLPSLDAKSTFRSKLYNTFVMASHLSAVILTGYILYLCFPFSQLFAWHPFLMTLACGFLMTESILFFSKEASLVPKVQRSTKSSYHWIAMVTAIVCALGGFGVIFYNKMANNKSHFTSWHGTCGLVVIIYMCVQSLAGTLNLYPKIAAKILKLKPADIKLYHATSGLFLYSFVYATFVLALFSNWFLKNSNTIGWWVSLACLAFMVLMIMNQVTTEYVPRAYRRSSNQY